jgi:hypothetical protein
LLLPLRLLLLEILIDEFRLPQQIGHVLLGHFRETGKYSELLLKLLGELPVFLVPPGLAKGNHLSTDRTGAVLQLGVKSLQVSSEAAKLLGINNGLRHEADLLQLAAERSRTANCPAK